MTLHKFPIKGESTAAVRMVFTLQARTHAHTYTHAQAHARVITIMLGLQADCDVKRNVNDCMWLPARLCPWVV